MPQAERVDVVAEAPPQRRDLLLGLGSVRRAGFQCSGDPSGGGGRIGADA